MIFATQSEAIEARIDLTEAAVFCTAHGAWTIETDADTGYRICGCY